MSNIHLQDLRNGIESHQWHIASELDGNEYDVSAIWKITKPGHDKVLHVEFEGLDEDSALPIEKSYACRVREYPDITAYFARKNRSWPDELKGFLSQLDECSK